MDLDPRFRELDDLTHRLDEAESGSTGATESVDDLRARIEMTTLDLVIDLGGDGVIDLPSIGPDTN